MAVVASGSCEALDDGSPARPQHPGAGLTAQGGVQGWPEGCLLPDSTPALLPPGRSPGSAEQPAISSAQNGPER